MRTKFRRCQDTACWDRSIRPLHGWVGGLEHCLSQLRVLDNLYMAKVNPKI